MTVVSYAGSPEAVAAYMTSLIALGNKIYVLKKAKITTKYVIVYGP